MPAGILLVRHHELLAVAPASDGQARRAGLDGARKLHIGKCCRRGMCQQQPEDGRAGKHILAADNVVAEVRLGAVRVRADSGKPIGRRRGTDGCCRCGGDGCCRCGVADPKVLAVEHVRRHARNAPELWPLVKPKAPVNVESERKEARKHTNDPAVVGRKAKPAVRARCRTGDDVHEIEARVATNVILLLVKVATAAQVARGGVTAAQHGRRARGNKDHARAHGLERRRKVALVQQPSRVGQRENARGNHGGVLAGRVARHGSNGNTQCAEDDGKGVACRKDARIRGRTGRCERGRRRLDKDGHAREKRVELKSPGVENEKRLHTARRARSNVAPRAKECLAQVRLARDDGGKAVLVRSAANGQRVAQIVNWHGSRLEMRKQALDLLAQTGLGSVGQNERHGTASGAVVLARVAGLDDQVRVRAAKSKGTDAGQAARERHAPARDDNRASVRRCVVETHAVRKLVVQLRNVQCGNDGRLAQHEHRLDEAGNAGRRLEVANVGLDRANDERRVAVVGHVDRAQRLDFNRVAKGRARPVRLDVPDVGHRDVTARQRRADDGRLRWPVRGSQAAAATVLVHRRAANDGQNRVAVAPSSREALERDDASAFATHVAVGRRIERLAVAVGTQHLHLREVDKLVRGPDHIGSARNCHVALAAEQRTAREVHRHERRRACSVDRHRRAIETKRVGEAARSNACCRARAEKLGHARRHGRAAAVVLQQRIVKVHEAHVDADGRTCACLARSVARVLQCRPRALQQKPLLRIHVGGLARRNAKQTRIKLAHVVHIAAHRRVRLARCTGKRGHVVRLAPPARVHALDRVRPGSQARPKRIDVVCAGESAADANDGHIVVAVVVDRRGTRCRRCRRWHSLASRAARVHGLCEKRNEALGP